MKRKNIFFRFFVLSIFCIVFNNSFYAQSGQKWSTGGNSIQSNEFIGTTNDQPLKIYVNNFEKMRILPNGKVGINCINPKFYLDVIGDGHYSGWLYVDSNLTIRNRLGINNFSPNFPLDVNGRSHFSGWLFADSNLTVLGFIGINTTAQYPLDVKGEARISSNLIVNENVLIDKNLYLNNTNPTGYTLLGLNQYKQVIPIAFSGNPDEVLTGAGTFLELPGSIGWRVLNGNIVTTENGNIGIGTEHPTAKLHVEGDAIITGGVLTSQVILSDKLQTYKIESDTATTWISVVQKLLSENVQSKTASIDTFQSKEASMDKIVVDKAQLDSINAIITESKKVITDTLQTILLNTDSIEVDKATAQSVSIGGAVNAANEKLAVVGNTGIYGDFNVTGNLKTSGNITFAQDKTISYSPSNNNTGIYSFATPWPHPTVDQCYSPSVGTDEFTFRGTFHSWGYVNNNTSNPINVMQMGFDGANGIIDLAGTNPNGNTRLLINYYCGKDVYINTGDNGGNVIMTRLGKVGIGTETLDEKLNVAGNIHSTGNIINGGADFILGVNDGHDSKLKTANRALVHNGWQTGQDNLVINYDGDFEDGVYVGGPKTIFEGKVGIGTANPDKELTVNGTIKARTEVVVEETGNWYDYVLENNYCKTPWKQREIFINTYKHLPKISSAKEIAANGLKTTETIKGLVFNIEEATLDIIELYKLIEKQNELINELKLEIENLKK